MIQNNISKSKAKFSEWAIIKTKSGNYACVVHYSDDKETLSLEVPSNFSEPKGTLIVQASTKENIELNFMVQKQHFWENFSPLGKENVRLIEIKIQRKPKNFPKLMLVSPQKSV